MMEGQNVYLKSILVICVSCNNAQSRLVSNAWDAIKPTHPNHQKKQAINRMDLTIQEVPRHIIPSHPGQKGLPSLPSLWAPPWYPLCRASQHTGYRLKNRKLPWADWVPSGCTYVMCVTACRFIVEAVIFILFWEGVNLAAEKMCNYCQSN